MFPPPSPHHKKPTKGIPVAYQRTISAIHRTRCRAPQSNPRYLAHNHPPLLYVPKDKGHLFFLVVSFSDAKKEKTKTKTKKPSANAPTLSPAAVAARNFGAAFVAFLLLLFPAGTAASVKGAAQTFSATRRMETAKTLPLALPTSPMVMV